MICVSAGCISVMVMWRHHNKLRTVQQLGSVTPVSPVSHGPRLWVPVVNPLQQVRAPRLKPPLLLQTYALWNHTRSPDSCTGSLHKHTHRLLQFLTSHTQGRSPGSDTCSQLFNICNKSPRIFSRSAIRSGPRQRKTQMSLRRGKRLERRARYC